MAISSRALAGAFSLIFATLLSFSANGDEPTKPTLTADQQQKLSAQLQSLFEKSDLPGFAVALVDRDGVFFSAGFGMADRESSKPFDPQTVLNIGSISKTFIGVAMMQAAEQGQVDFDAPVEKYLPYKVRNPRFKDTPITLRHLATHTSGILDLEEVYELSYCEGQEPSRPLGAYLRSYLDPKGGWFKKKNFSKNAPGTFYEYSNIGAALAAHVIETVTGVSFDELTSQNVLKPLAMNDTGWSYATANLERHATLYEDNQPLEDYTLITYPDGGLRTSASSLGRYLAMIIAGGQLGDTQVLKASSVKSMLAPQLQDNLPGLGRRQEATGLFWSHSKSGGIGHTGGDPGISTFMSFEPETGRGRIFLTNTQLDNEHRVASFREIWQTLKPAVAP